MSTAGIILAAGESRRMGFPKALLRYRDRTFLDTLTGLLAGRCSPVIVVLGAHADRIRERSLDAAEFVLNPDYARGMTTSLQCGLRAVPQTATGVLFTLVDHPAVDPLTLDALLATRLGDPFLLEGTTPSRSWLRSEPRASASGCPGAPTPAVVLVRVPRYGGQRGHPIWFSRELIPEFLALPAGGAARDVVRAHACETEFLDVDDPGILADIDDAEAYRKLTGAIL